MAFASRVIHSYSLLDIHVQDVSSLIDIHVRVLKWGLLLREGGFGLPAWALRELHLSFSTEISQLLRRPGRYALCAALGTSLH